MSCFGSYFYRDLWDAPRLQLILSLADLLPPCGLFGALKDPLGLDISCHLLLSLDSHQGLRVVLCHVDALDESFGL